jgi:ferredoxin
MIIAARAVGASDGVIYIRYEYQAQRENLLMEIDALRTEDLLGEGFDIAVRRAAGLYVCGEESALLNSLEGRRPVPRDRPPYPDAGLFGRPTLIQNAETLAAVPAIIAKGAAWYRDTGSPKLYCVSGDVAKPGVFELPLGTTVRELLSRAGGSDVKAFTLGGLSGGLLPASALDVKLDFEDRAATAPPRLRRRHRARPWPVCRPFRARRMRFFAGESCGKCFCRIGTTRLRERLEVLATARPRGRFQTCPYADSVQEMPDIIDVLYTALPAASAQPRARWPNTCSRTSRRNSSAHRATVLSESAIMSRMRIDGQAVDISPGETIVDAARRAGTDIPTLCYDPRLSPGGSCRLCLVEVEGRAQPVPACAFPASAEMSVNTGGERLDTFRRDLLDLVLSEIPDGECRQVH